jgi:hypothetical protein
VSFFVEAQTRFNVTKLLAVIEEAWQPENRNREFVACPTHISPAELVGFFLQRQNKLDKALLKVGQISDG